MSAPLRTPPEVFERLYSDSADPWRYASSPYEAAKYTRTLAALNQRRYARALEVGCSIGVFTDGLAARCEAVIALDPSPTALTRARARLADRDNVEFRLGAVPEQFPDGVFDLVVCSEVLFYLGEELLLQTLHRIEGQLAPGGTLIAVHFRQAPRRWAVAVRSVTGRRLWSGGRPSPRAALSGDRVHELLRSNTCLALTDELVQERYRLARFDRQL